MKVLKKSKGFTLVELIVVIAIIGILAAVLIPSISGYVVKARQSAALQEAQPVLTAYTTYWVDLEAENIPAETTFIDYAVDLVNKATPKEILESKNTDFIGECPACFRGLEWAEYIRYNYNFCPHCGQALTMKKEETK